MEQYKKYMEDKCLYIRPNNQGLFDMNLICNIKQVATKYESHTDTRYIITFNNREELTISSKEYEDLLEQMTEEYSYYENDIDDSDEDDEESSGYTVTDDDYEVVDDTTVVSDYESLFKQDNKIHW